MLYYRSMVLHKSYHDFLVLPTSVPARTPTGRLVLARAILSVQFQSGISVTYNVSHVKTYHSPDSTKVRNVATSLARDQNMFV